MKSHKFFNAFFDNKVRFILSIIFIGAFLIRLATICLITGWEGIHGADADRYDKVARSLIEGKGFALEGTVVILYALPVYPLFLAAIYKVFGHKYWIALLIQTFIGSLSCLLGYLIGTRLFSKGVGLLTALIMAVHPYLSLLTVYLITETLFTLLLLLAVLWLIKSDKEPSLKYCLWIGFWLGLATLTRPLTLIFPFFIFIWGWLNFQTKRAAFKTALLTTLFMSLVIVPWAYRNYKVSGNFIPFYIGTGSNLWMGNNPEVFKKVDKRGTLYLPDNLRIKKTDLFEVELDRRYGKMALEFIRKNPKEFLILLYFKFLRFWQWGYPTTLRNTLATFLYGVFFFPFMVAGFFLSLKYSRRAWILHLLVVFFTTFSLIFFGSDGYTSTRYRVPLEPYLSIFAAYGLMSFIQRYWPKSLLLRILE